MIDLKNLKGGLKLIKYILAKGNKRNQPWTKDKQRQFMKNYQNIKPKKST